MNMRIGSWPGPSYSDNPFVSILCSGLEALGSHVVDVRHPADIERGSLDILQLHWAEQVFWGANSARDRTCEIARLLHAIHEHRAAGTRVAWMVHNLAPHRLSWRSERLLWPLLRRAFQRLSDVLIALSPETAPVIEKAYGLKPHSVKSIRHPRYPPGPSYQQARAKLGLTEHQRQLTFFGSLRPNKGIEELLTTFKQIADPNLLLRVIGKAENPAYFVQRAGDDPRIKLRLEFAERETIALNAAAAEAVVIPLAGQLHSGSLVDALSLGAPVITRQSPYALGLVKDLGAEWVRTFSDVLDPAELSRRRPSGRPDLSLYEPRRVAGELLGIYQAIPTRAKGRAL